MLASTSVPFALTTVQMPNFALIETKWITVCGESQLFVIIKAGSCTDKDSHALFAQYLKIFESMFFYLKFSYVAESRIDQDSQNSLFL
jgi:hypothetical protein